MNCHVTKPPHGRTFIFKQYGVPANPTCLVLEWIAPHYPDFIKKEDWPLNSPDLNPLHYHVWGAMLEKYKTYTPKLTNKVRISEDFPQDTLDQTVLAFQKRLLPYVQAEGDHFEHLFR